QIAVLIDGAAHLIGLDLVRVDRVGTNLLRSDAVRLHGVHHRSWRRGHDHRGARRRINHSLITAPFEANMVGPREPHGKRHRQHASRPRARPLLVTSHHRISFRSPPGRCRARRDSWRWWATAHTNRGSIGRATEPKISKAHALATIPAGKVTPCRAIGAEGRNYAGNEGEAKG